jgi:hypothetical protein
VRRKAQLALLDRFVIAKRMRPTITQTKTRSAANLPEAIDVRGVPSRVQFKLLCNY